MVAVLGAAMLALVVVLAGCGGGSSSGPSSKQTERWDDHTLIVAGPSTPSTLNGDAMSDPVDFTAHWNLYDQLVGWDQKGSDPVESDLSKVVPRLATSWTVSPDGKVYEFDLRKGIKSADGNPMTAQTVKDQWTAAYHREGVGTLIYAVSNIAGPESIKVVSPYKIRFELTAPSALFLKALTIHTAGVQDSTEIEKHVSAKDPYGAEWLNSNAAGFGPYRIAKFDPGSQVVYEANPNYWKGKPYFTKVVYKAIPSASDRVALLRTGEVDLSEGLSPRDYEDLSKASNVDVVESDGISAVSLRFNMGIKPFDNKAVREAIAYATPVERIINEVYYGKARPMKSIFPDKLPGYKPEWNDSYDPEKGKEILEKAGIDHLNVSFAYNTAAAQMQNLAVLLQESLGEIGIDVQLEPTPPQAFTDGLFAHKFGFFADTDKPLVPDEGYTLFLWFGESPINYTAYSNPQVSCLIEKTMQMEDGPQRNAVADEAMKKVLADVPWVPIAFVDSQVAIAKGLSGVTWYPLDVTRWSDLEPSGG
jgi:peptide/nickel transport system substrate-binding protein